MKINYTDNVKQWPEGFELVQKATNRLEEVIGPANAPFMSGEWDRTEGEKGQKQFTLHLKNPDGEVTSRFDLDDLQNPHLLSSRMHNLWNE